MAEFVRELLRVGTTFDDFELRRIVEDFRSMKKLNLLVSIPWDDSGETDELLRRRARCRDNTGWVHDVFIQKGVLKARLVMNLSEDVKKFLETKPRLVSRFSSFEDGAGRYWRNVLIEVLLVPTVNHQFSRSDSEPRKHSPGSHFEREKKMAHDDITNERERQIMDDLYGTHRKRHQEDAEAERFMRDRLSKQDEGRHIGVSPPRSRPKDYDPFLVKIPSPNSKKT